MGSNTGVMFLNDAFGDVRDDPKGFVEGMMPFVHAAQTGRFSIGNHSAAGMVFHSSHADVFKPYILGGNTVSQLPCDLIIHSRGIAENDLQLEFLQRIADKMGYRLVKKRD